MRLSRLYLWLMAVAVVGGLALIANLFLGIGIVPRDEKPLLCAMVLLFYSLAGLGCAAAFENGHAPILMRSGMIIGALALLTWWPIIIFDSLQSTFHPVRAAMWLTTWTCLMLLVAVILLLPMRHGWRWWVRTTTFGMLALLALFIALGFTFYPDYNYSNPNASWPHDWEYRRTYEEFTFRVGGAIAMLAGGALAVTVIAGVSTALMGISSGQPTIGRPFWLKCPRCGCEQEARTGEHLCISCGLRARVELT